MKSYPSIPYVSDAPPEMLQRGHLWILEKVDGGLLRFRLDTSGMIEFATRDRAYRPEETLPKPYRRAVRYVSEHLDRDGLRRAVDDVEEIVLFGESMHRNSIPYEWDRTPPLLGIDVWNGQSGRFLTPDVVEQIFERLDLVPVNAVRRELRARDFDPDRFEIPDSKWYVGPAEGVVLRNKRGGRAKLLHPRFVDIEDPVLEHGSGVELARRYATERRLEGIVERLEAGGDPVTFDGVYERLLEEVFREAHPYLDRGDQPLDEDAFRSEIATLTGQYLGGGDRT